MNFFINYKTKQHFENDIFQITTLLKQAKVFATKQIRENNVENSIF